MLTQDKHTHQLNAPKPSDSKRDRISLVATLLVQHRDQVLKLQTGAGTDQHRRRTLYKRHWTSRDLIYVFMESSFDIFSFLSPTTTHLGFSGACASCSTLELKPKWIRTVHEGIYTSHCCHQDWRRFMVMKGEQVCCTYSSNSSRCSVGIVSSNTLKQSCVVSETASIQKLHDKRQSREKTTVTENRYAGGIVSRILPPDPNSSI